MNKKNLFRIVLALWLACAAAFLAVGLASYGSWSDGEDATVLGMRRMNTLAAMQALGFPAALVVPPMVISAGRKLGVDLFSEADAIGFVKDWTLLFVLGAVQWFVLVPWLLRLAKRLR